ncbi:MAG: SDR family oxidoreductase, partial [Gammaproteobacteria bacterium]
MKNIVISGASKGIGRATAEKFVASGARVFNLSRSPSGVTGVIDIAIDLSLDTASEALAETLLPQLEGQVDVLIHNAAKLINDTLQSAESEALADVLNINVIAPQRLNQALIPLMSAGSAILYIGSTLSEKAVANSFSYVTSKHAMVGMMRASCQDLAGTGIHTACICPGFTNTEMLRA